MHKMDELLRIVSKTVEELYTEKTFDTEKRSYYLNSGPDPLF